MVNISKYVPERGDIIWLNFHPQAGHEQSGRRPAFVLTPSYYNERVGLAICCPITSQIKGYPFEVVIPNGHNVQGAILSDQIKSLDWKKRNAKFICRVSQNATREVLSKLATLIS